MKCVCSGYLVYGYPMHIVHIAAEMAPVVKVGGLADVILGLSRELQDLKHKVEIIIPKYDSIHLEDIKDLKRGHTTFKSSFNEKRYDNVMWTGFVEGLTVHFLDPIHPQQFFKRDKVYGYEDDLDRFLYFSRAVMDYLASRKGETPDVIHLHEWQTAVIAPLYKDYFKNKFNNSKIVLNLHNMGYQGRCQTHHLDMVGLKGEDYLHPEKMEDNLYPGVINLLKGGIVYSDYFVTVSPTYSREICTPQFGEGLDSTVIQYKDKFRGILNGIDLEFWNSKTDRYLPVHYSSLGLQKEALKKILRKRFGLKDDSKPIVGCISRLVPQKGMDLIKHAIDEVQKLGGQYIVMGSAFSQDIEFEFGNLSHKYQDHPDVHISLDYQEDLAHLIFAACDMLIVPSIFEPCGLTQIIALRYGTIPIVRRTGGLADTVFDIENEKIPEEQRNGFTFEEQTEKAFDEVLRRAFDYYNNHPDKWYDLVRRVMRADYGWTEATKQYLEIYRR